MAYWITERGFPHKFRDDDKQIWFESLQHISKFELPPHLVSGTKLKLLGIKSDDFKAVAWAYQPHNHDIYLLYDINNHVPHDGATENQRAKYNKYLEQLERFKNGELSNYYFER